MNPQEYTPEEQKDIEERVAKAQKALKELELFPCASVAPHNIGEDMFVMKVVPYLQDMKYRKEPIKSPFPKI